MFKSFSRSFRIASDEFSSDALDYYRANKRITCGNNTAGRRSIDFSVLWASYAQNRGANDKRTHNTSVAQKC